MNSCKQYKIRLCSVNTPVYEGNEAIFLHKDILTWEAVCDEIFIITGHLTQRYGPKVHIIEIENAKKQIKGFFGRIIYHFVTQIKMAISLIRISKRIDIVVFNVGEYRNLLPIITSKLLRKKTAIFHHGGDKILESKISCNSGWKRLLPPMEAFLLNASYYLADYILCQSQLNIKIGKLEKYDKKIIIWIGYYIDTSRFIMGSPPGQKADLIGYCGRLTKVKGLANLVRAVPLVLEHNKNARFIIAGHGEEWELIENEIEALNLKEFVSLLTWVSDEGLPKFLNSLKIFVLPSYIEGIPSILREAMSCGTIVLATPVGAIPDLIVDGVTGFILENNLPECIAKNILRVLEYPSLDKIAQNAKSLIEKESTFQATVDRWKGLLEKIINQVTLQ